MSFEDNIILRIRRQYSKDESMNFVLDSLTKAKLEIGMLKSELAEERDINRELRSQLEQKRVKDNDVKKSVKKKIEEMAEQSRLTIFWRDKYLELKNKEQ